MTGKLTKAQRMYARERLIETQNSKCCECGEKIYNLTPDVVLPDNWRRGVLFEDEGRLKLGCQPCATDINMGFKSYDKQIAEVERKLSA